LSAARVTNLQVAELKKRIKDNELNLIGVSYVDLGGVSRMKPQSAREIDFILKSGFKTSRANLAMTSYDQLVRGSSLNISQGDLSVIPDINTFVIPSFLSKIGRFIGNLHEKDGSVSEVCPRSFLKGVLERASKFGYRFEVGFEAEFHLVRREGGSVVPADLAPVQGQDGFNLHSNFFNDALGALESVNVEVEKAHLEGGRGQVEFDVAHHSGLKPADDIVYFKEAVKAVARNHGYVASFMPKIGSDWWGTGLHFHLSLWDSGAKENANLFFDRNGRFGLSEDALHFIGGMLYHLPALTAVCCPTVNSYRRLLQGKWNADAQAYGAGARGAAIRIPDERASATRLECRFPDGACNPYLALGCILACGLEGIEKKLDPGRPLEEDLSFLSDREIREKGFALMPRSLYEANCALEKDEFIRSAMGDLLFDEYVKHREHDIAQAADKVSQWEIDRFLDIF
jgi:glutamine synthetase